MFGHLPLRHLLLVAAVMLLAGLVLGAWLGTFPTTPFHAGAGATAGAFLGVTAVAALVGLNRDSHPRGPRHW